MALMSMALTLGAAVTLAADAVDAALAPWLGKEITIQTATTSDQIPVGGKLTLVFDAEDNVVRVCTRTAAGQKGPWQMDFAIPCNVTLTFTRGTRYCTLDDVKTGNAEVLSSCHRLRSREIAMTPAKTKGGAVELNDMIVFLIQGEYPTQIFVSILVDSPSRVTSGGAYQGKGGTP